jgi:hypothetical protein
LWVYAYNPFFPPSDGLLLTLIMSLAIEWKLLVNFFDEILMVPSSSLPLSITNKTSVGGISSSLLAVLSAIEIDFLCGALS